MRRDSEREALQIPSRITGIVCHMRHTSRERWCKMAHQVSESDDLGIIGGCDVGIRIDRDSSVYLFGGLARTGFVVTKSHWRVAAGRATSHLEPLDIHSARA